MNCFRMQGFSRLAAFAERVSSGDRKGWLRVWPLFLVRSPRLLLKSAPLALALSPRRPIAKQQPRRMTPAPETNSSPWRTRAAGSTDRRRKIVECTMTTPASATDAESAGAAGKLSVLSGEYGGRRPTMRTAVSVRMVLYGGEKPMYESTLGTMATRASNACRLTRKRVSKRAVSFRAKAAIRVRSRLAAGRVTDRVRTNCLEKPRR